MGKPAGILTATTSAADREACIAFHQVAMPTVVGRGAKFSRYPALLGVAAPSRPLHKPGPPTPAGCMHHDMSTWAPFEFRNATNQDVPGIWTLISSVLTEYGIDACQRTTDSDLNDIERSYWDAGGVFFVLLEDGQVIGTVALHRQSATVCELCRMYLSSRYRGRGLGRRLLNAALEEARARGYEEVVLETAAVLTEAIGLYRTAGFQTACHQPKGGSCDLAMSRRL